MSERRMMMGGAPVTVTGLEAGNVKNGVNVTVKQGYKTVADVTGTFAGGGGGQDVTVTFESKGATATLIWGDHHGRTNTALLDDRFPIDVNVPAGGAIYFDGRGTMFPEVENVEYYSPLTGSEPNPKEFEDCATFFASNVSGTVLLG